MSFSGSILPRGVFGAGSLLPPGERQARGESGGVRATPPEAPESYSSSRPSSSSSSPSEKDVPFFNIKR